MQRAARQEQFLEVVDRAEAEARFRKHLVLAPLGEESVSLIKPVGRVLSRDVVAGIDVPGFDRSSMDGFAVRAADTSGASSEQPRVLRLNSRDIDAGCRASHHGYRGNSDNHSDGWNAAARRRRHRHGRRHGNIGARRRIACRSASSRAAGAIVAVAGGDIARGETLFRAGQILSSREIGSLAADRSGRGLRYGASRG